MRTRPLVPSRFFPFRPWLSAVALMVGSILSALGAAGPMRVMPAEGGEMAAVVLWPAEGAAQAPAYLAARALVEGTGREDETPLTLALPGYVAVGYRLPSGRVQRLAALLRPLLRPRLPSRKAMDSARRTLETRARAARGEPGGQARRMALLALLGSGAAAESLEAQPGLWAEIATDEVKRMLDEFSLRPLPVLFAGPPAGAPRLAAELETRVERDFASLRFELPEVPATVQRLRVQDLEAPAGTLALVHGLRFDRRVAERHGAALELLAESLAEGEGSLAQRLRVALGPEAVASVEVVAAADGGGVLLLGAEVRPGQGAAAWKVLMAALDSAARQSFRRDAVLRARRRLDGAADRRRSEPERLLVDELLTASAWRWPPADRWKRPMDSSRLKPVAADLLASAARVAVEAGAPAAVSVELAGFPEPRLVAPLDHCGRDLPRPCRVKEEQRRERARQRALELLRALGGDGARPVPVAYVARYSVEEMTPAGPVISEMQVEAGPERARASWRAGERKLEIDSSPGSDRLVTGEQQESEVGAVGLDQLEQWAFREPAVLAGAVVSGLLPAEVPEGEVAGAAPRPFLRVELAQGSVIEVVVQEGGTRPEALRVWWPGRAADAEPDEELVFESWRRAGGLDVASRIIVRGRLGRRQYTLREWSWSRPLPRVGELPENRLDIE
ncbi:MAG: hypothetical protein Q9Q40_02300 [Acidobacteriota bacterium]|nr:hypothetical protein [Acidobacteriota bacterium]